MAHDSRTWIAVVCFGALAPIFFISGTNSTELACDRATNGCRLSTQSILGDGESRFRVDDVREVRFVDKLGKNGRQAESVLIFGDGSELRLARDDSEDAEPHFRTFHAFFAPDGPPSLSWRERGSPFAIALAVACAVGFVWFGRDALKNARRRGETVGKAETTGDPASWRRYALFAGGLFALAAVLTTVMYFVELRSNGRLDLECKRRCRFQGMECLPGGSMSMSLEPGSHTIEIWTASGEARWTPRQFDVRVGETTRFVCEL